MSRQVRAIPSIAFGHAGEDGAGGA